MQSRVVNILPALCVCASLLVSGVTEARAVETGVAAERSKPAYLRGLGIDQKLGTRVPLDLAFRDEEGRAVRLGD